MLVYISPRQYISMENKIMIALNDLRSCDKCGNVFLKKVGEKITNRCPACNVWKKETIL